MTDLSRHFSVKFGVVVLAIAIVWPPVFYLLVAPTIKTEILGRGALEDYELQLLLDARRWVLEVPRDKDGWFVRLEWQDENGVHQSSGGSVEGGSRIVLMCRRLPDSKKLVYRYYASDGRNRSGTMFFIKQSTSSSSAGGMIDDPISGVPVYIARPDGKIEFGDPIFRGGNSSVPLWGSDEKADREVRVVLSKP